MGQSVTAQSWLNRLNKRSGHSPTNRRGIPLFVSPNSLPERLETKAILVQSPRLLRRATARTPVGAAMFPRAAPAGGRDDSPWSEDRVTVWTPLRGCRLWTSRELSRRAQATRHR